MAREKDRPAHAPGYPRDFNPNDPPKGSSPADPFAQDPNLIQDPKGRDRSDYPETPSQAANPAPDEQGFDAVNPSDAVGAPEPKKVRYHDDDEPMSREQWQSLDPKRRPEWVHPLLASRQK